MTNSSKTILNRLRALRADCGPNKNDQATALIAACILEGWNTDVQIVGALGDIGMDAVHVRIRLDKGTGPSSRRNWRCDDEGHYSLNDDAILG